MKTYGYDEHSNKIVVEGTVLCLDDIKTIQLIKDKKVDLHMLALCELHTYNYNYKNDQLTEEEFKAIKEWLCQKN